MSREPDPSPIAVPTPESKTHTLPHESGLMRAYDRLKARREDLKLVLSEGWVPSSFLNATDRAFGGLATS